MNTTDKDVSSDEIFPTTTMIAFLYVILKQKTTDKRMIQAEINLQCKSDIVLKKHIILSCRTITYLQSP